MLLRKLLFPYYKKIILEFTLKYGMLNNKQVTRVLNFAKYGTMTCEICGKPLSYGKKNKIGTIDHIIPKSKGGNNHFTNLRIAHYKCNAKRGNNLCGQDLNLYLDLGI